MKTHRHLAVIAICLAAVPAFAQQSDQPAPQQSAAPAPLARHLVMFTREGPNFDKIRYHMDEARSHQALYVRLAAEGIRSPAERSRARRSSE